MSYQEIPLMRNLREFDVVLAQRYVAAAQVMLAESLRFEPGIEKIVSEGTTLGFRYKTSTPIYLMLSHPICRFSSSRPYMINPTFEKFFSEELGLIPVYLASYNRMSILKTWGSTTKLFFDPYNSPLNESQPVCWQLGSSDRPPEISSMNFILKNSSPISIAPERVSELMKRYFSQFFWETQSFDISRSTHFLHFADRVSGVVNVAKTIFVVKQVVGKREIEIQLRPVQCMDLLVSGIFKDENGYHLQDHRVLIESSAAKSFDLDRSEHYGFFNGVVTEIKRKYQSMKLFQIVDSYETIYFELIQDLIGLVCIDRFRKWDTLSNVGTVEGIRQEVAHILNLMSRETKLEMTVGSLFDDWFEKALREMFPILYVKNDHTYYVHPLVWGLFERIGFQYEPNPNDGILESLVSILEKILVISPAKLRQMYEFDIFQTIGINKEFLKREIRKLANEINITKTMSKKIPG